jgi:hypothetical protein
MTFPITAARVVVGISHDTSAFAAHAIAHWWQQEGMLVYAGSRQLLILADTGGSNGYCCRTWKTELQSQVVDDLGSRRNGRSLPNRHWTAEACMG